MKQKVSVSLEKETLTQLEEALKDGRFRNKSHLIEYSLNKLLKEEVKND